MFGRFCAGRFPFLGAVVAFGVVSGTAQAAIVTNGSFELGNDPGSFTTLNALDSTSITGWTVSNGSVDYIGTYWQASNGVRSIDMNGVSAGTISQTLTGLTINQEYTVKFDLAGNPNSGPTVKQLDVMASAGNQSFFFDTTGHSRPDMGWVTETFKFTATSTSEVLSFASAVFSGGGNGFPAAFGPALDNVSVTATPLPAAALLFGTGLGFLGLLAARRKRKNAAISAVC